METFSLRSCSAHPPKGVYWLHIPPRIIGTLKQMRSEMSSEGLEDLTASIKQVGQINPGIVVGLTAKEASKYLRLINKMWGTSYRLSSFTPVSFQELDEPLYLFLVAGHRRHEAVFQARIKEGFYCQVRLETNFSSALVLQFQENLHEAVPQDDEARFLTFLWQREKTARKGLTVAGFARRLGKRPDVIRRAVRFTALPVRVQKLVRPSTDFKKGIAYGILCELARLQEAREEAKKAFNEAELLQLAYSLVTHYKTVGAARGWVSEQISELHGQNKLFELDLQEVVDGARKTVASGLENAVRTGTEHFRVVARLHTAGVKKIASSSAANAVANAVELTRDLAPKIVEGLNGARHASRAREALKTT